jgi:predicted TIM-barrel fold metal-dependent hydrolase
LPGIGGGHPAIHRRAVDAFGFERIVFGGDWPVPPERDDAAWCP